MARPHGLILAGGRGRRMGGTDKAGLVLGGRSLLDRVAARFAPQVAALAIGANGDPARFGARGLPVLADPLPDYAGPLAGILAGLDWAAAAGARALATVPVDAPFLPRDLVMALGMAASAYDTPFAVAESAGPDGVPRAHPTCALWPIAAREDLRRALASGERRLGAFLAARGAARICFGYGATDPFFNVNAPGDLQAAEALIAEHGW